VLDRPPPLLGWRTTDEDEVALRRWRGRTEIIAIEAMEPNQPFFGTFRVQSGSGDFYEVEIRDLDGFNNSCGCIPGYSADRGLPGSPRCCGAGIDVAGGRPSPFKRGKPVACCVH
jgi:hypothetical protein